MKLQKQEILNDFVNVSDRGFSNNFDYSGHFIKSMINNMIMGET